MPDYIIRRDRGQAEAQCLRPKPRPKFWPRGHFVLEDLTSLVSIDLFMIYHMIITVIRLQRQVCELSSQTETWGRGRCTSVTNLCTTDTTAIRCQSPSARWLMGEWLLLWFCSRITVETTWRWHVESQYTLCFNSPLSLLYVFFLAFRDSHED